ncbi:hypothetical protein [Streptomyces sp. NPDC059009]
MTAEDLMSGFSFHVDAEEFAAEAQALEEMATASGGGTTTFCCTVQCC